MNKINLPQEILNLLRRKSEEEWEYINPHFLSDITTALEGYYAIEDAKVDKWISDMWSA